MKYRIGIELPDGRSVQSEIAEWNKTQLEEARVLLEDVGHLTFFKMNVGDAEMYLPGELARKCIFWIRKVTDE